MKGIRIGNRRSTVREELGLKDLSLSPIALPHENHSRIHHVSPFELSLSEPDLKKRLKEELRLMKNSSTNDYSSRIKNLLCTFNSFNIFETPSKSSNISPLRSNKPRDDPNNLSQIRNHHTREDENNSPQIKAILQKKTQMTFPEIQFQRSKTKIQMTYLEIQFQRNKTKTQMTYLEIQFQRNKTKA